MALILHSFPGDVKLDDALAALMIKKAEEYHCCQKPVTLVLDYIHQKEDGTPLFPGDRKKWHLRRPADRARWRRQPTDGRELPLDDGGLVRGLDHRLAAEP
jgi:hypothetical protein